MSQKLRNRINKLHDKIMSWYYDYCDKSKYDYRLDCLISRTIKTFEWCNQKYIAMEYIASVIWKESTRILETFLHKISGDPARRQEAVKERINLWNKVVTDVFNIELTMNQHLRYQKELLTTAYQFKKTYRNETMSWKPSVAIKELVRAES